MATMPYIVENNVSASSHSTAEPGGIALPGFRSSSLLFRFLLINLLAFGLLGAAVREGYIEKIVNADQTRLSVAIFIVFLVGLCISGWRVWQINKEIDSLSRSSVFDASKDTSDHASGNSANQTSPAKAPAGMGSLRLNLTQRIASVRHIANLLVLLGLIGTVLGFIIALSGVDPDTASDVNSIAPMVSVLIQGMSTALYTTLIGSVLNVWLTANYQILAGGTVQLMGLWLDRADDNA